MSRLDRRVAVIALIALAAVTSCTAPAAPATSSPSATAAAAASPSPSPVATPRPTSAPWVTPSSGVEMAIEDPDLAINLPLSWRQVTEEEVEAQFAQYQAAGVDAATIERLRAQLSGTHAIATGYTPGGISIGISMIVMDDLGPGTDVVERYRERMLQGSDIESFETAAVVLPIGDAIRIESKAAADSGMGSKGIPSRTIAYVIRLGGAHAVVLIATSVQDDLTFASMMESVAASFHVSHGPATHGTTDASTVTLPGEDIRFVAPARWVGVPLDGIRTSLGASVAAAAPADRAYWQAWLDWFDSGRIRYALSAPPTENASIFVLLDERDRDFASSTERLLAETLGETAARDPGARRPIDVPAGQAIMATAPFATAVQVSIVVVLMRLPGERTLAMIGLGRSTDDAFEGVVRDLAESVAVG